MPMDPSGLKSKIKARVHDGLKAQFGSAVGLGASYPPIADVYWEKLAEAISGIAADIVTEITTNAEVKEGIPTKEGGPTVAPGKIL